MLDPLVVLPFVIVVALVGAIAFVFRGSGGNKAAASRLDVLVGKRRTESSQEILLKKELFEADKNKILESLAALVPNLQKIFEQADANIKPGTLALFGVGLGLIGVMGSLFAGVPMAIWPVSFLILF